MWSAMVAVHRLVPGSSIMLWLAMLAGPVGASVVSEQAADSTAAATTEATGRTDDRVIYLDVPVVLEPGVDPVLPLLAIADPAPSSPDPELARRIGEYDASLQAMETENGIWAASLIEPLTARGNLQQLLGDHAAAVRTFDHAMHVNRINNGLHSTRQIPIVEELIESYLAMEDWSNADLYYNYLFYVQQKAYGTDDPRMIPVLAQLGRWHLQAFNIGFGDTLALRLSSAQLLFDAAVRMVALHFGRQDERFVAYLRHIANSAYLAASNPDLIAQLGRPDYGNSHDLLATRLNQRAPIVPAGFRAGEIALRQVVSVYEEAAETPYRLAEAHATLADWYLLFQQTRAADQHYRLAWNLLAAQENAAELLPRLFGRVTPIPTFSTAPRRVYRGGSQRKSPAELRTGFVDLSFSVTRNGELRRVEILPENSAATAEQMDRVARELRSYRFRPQVRDGMVSASDDNRVRVRFWY